jgi:hypothetical protein
MLTRNALRTSGLDQLARTSGSRSESDALSIAKPDVLCRSRRRVRSLPAETCSITIRIRLIIERLDEAQSRRRQT